MKKLGLILLLVVFVCPSPARAGQGKDFIMSVVYGTLAGTLVGAATLAFTTSPGDNLNNVARGASYGLYAGILLGVYVTYGLDDSPEENTEKKPGDEEENQDSSQTPQSRNGLGNNSELKVSLQPFVIPPRDFENRWGLGFNFLQYRF